jgi:hypothetical protein
VKLALLFVLTVLTAAPMSQAGDDDSYKVRDWKVRRMPEGAAVALTNNESGAVLGVLCLKAGICSIYFSDAVGCREGEQYSVLANTEDGAIAATAHCKAMGDSHLLWLDPYAEIMQAMLKKRWISIAKPIKGGEFKTSKFSLDGCSEALNVLHRDVG